jgi:hypothetical protein
MATRVKRTYNLPERTVHRVRELAAGGRPGRSQDAVVEAAVERLYVEMEAEEEARSWTAAADDPAFRAERAEISRDLDAPDSWPA